MAWWGGGDESDSGSDLYSSEDENVAQEPTRQRTFTLDESSSDEEGRRVVRSKKTARFEDLRKSTDTMASKMKINDWVAILEGTRPRPRSPAFLAPSSPVFRLC